MLIAPFEAPRLKVRRAQRHIAELQAQVAGYLGKTPFRAVVEHDGPGRQRLTFRVSKAVPKELSAIIGDAIHNLRAALDLLACEAVRLNGQSDEDVCFPFCANAGGLEDMIKRRHLDRAAPAAVDVVRGLAPYKGGNTSLRALHDLDIQDKHLMLLPTTDWANFGNVMFGNITVGIGQHYGPVQDGFSPFGFAADPKLKTGHVVKAQYHLTLGPLLPLGTQEVVSMGEDLVKLVAKIIDSFEAALFPPSP